MNKNSITQYKSLFNSIVKHIESDDAKEQIEVWFARELQSILGYARWENFLVAIHRAMVCLQTATDIGLCPLKVIAKQMAGIGYEI